MQLVRQNLRTQSPFGELGDPPLPKHSKILIEEEYHKKQIQKSNSDKNIQKNLFYQTDNKYHEKVPNENGLDNADFIEQLMIKASSNKQRRQSSNFSSNKSYHIDKLLQNENNDWFFEKILEKFEDIRSKRNNQVIESPSNEFDNDTVYGVERIIERRYYVKKPKLLSKRDQLTSTSDLTGYDRKPRHYSGTSTVTRATTCSQCSSSSPPTYVENLRNQSDSLRNEIMDLKDDIERLQTTQQNFFQQLQTQLQLRTNGTPTTTPPQNSIKYEPLGNKSMPAVTGRRSRSISTESLSSSSETTSEESTSTAKTPEKPIAKPLNGPTTPASQISEFIATKNPSIAPTPPGSIHANSRHSSIVPKSQSNGYSNSKPPSIAQGSQPNTFGTTRFASITSVSSSNSNVTSKHSSVAPTPQFNARPPPTASEFQTNAHSNGRPPPMAPELQSNALIKPKSTSATPTSSSSSSPTSEHSSAASTPKPTANALHNSKPPSIASIQPSNVFLSTKPPPGAPISSASSNAGSRHSLVSNRPQFNPYLQLKPLSSVPTSQSNVSLNSKPLSVPPIQQSNVLLNPKPLSVPSISPASSNAGSRHSSVASTPQPTVQHNSKPPSIPVAPPLPPADKSMIFKPPSIPTPPPLPPADTPVNFKPPSIPIAPPLPPADDPVGFKPPSIPAAPPLPPADAPASFKPPLMTPTPSVNSPFGSSTNSPLRPVNLRTTSAASTPPIASTSMSSVSVPIYENELAHRRIFSPHSQIVASSATSAQDSSDASSRSVSPEIARKSLQQFAKVPEATLRDNDLDNLFKYSSQLGVSGFPPALDAVIFDPNTSSIFWDSVDQYIESNKPTNTGNGLPPLSRQNNEYKRQVNNNTTKQLDKYDLEIKPQTIIESSAPLIMPPLDI